jgi:signal transduction histidine kinase
MTVERPIHIAAPPAGMTAPRWRVRLWPATLAGRTALVLLLALAAVQVAGLTIHALDRIGLQVQADQRAALVRALVLYRNVVLSAPDERTHLVADYGQQGGMRSRILQDLPVRDMPPLPEATQRLLRAEMQLVPIPVGLRPRPLMLLGGERFGKLHVGMRMPDQGWLDVEVPLPTPSPWHSRSFLYAFALMTVAAAVLIVWATRRLIRPVGLLAAAADRLGRDVNAAPLPETGPLELARAARAFNTMAARIRRFVADRTFMLAAIGHDLKTPITRLQLRTEFIEDEELRAKMQADLDELLAMVRSTLEFGRDVATDEPLSPVDLASLVRTVADEAGDLRPELAAKVDVTGPEHLPVPLRSMALKRALSNLVANALKYGGAAHIALSATPHLVTITIEDEGPGLPPEEIERVFQPFYRVENSRNRETGGTGLGLSIARDILRAHGGDVTLANRPGGGLRATVTLPQ